MRKIFFALTLGIVLTGTLLTGCGGKEEEAAIANVADETSTPETNVDENMVFAQVTAVEGNEITYEILERDENAPSKGDMSEDGEKPEKPESSAMPDGEMPERPEGGEMPDGEMPERPEGSAMPDGEMPEMPEGSAMPDGERPEMPEGGMMGMLGFQSTGETATITVDDSITIQFIQGQESTESAAIEDISVGTMLMLQYSEDDKVETIAIPKMGGRKNADASGEAKASNE